MRRISLMIFSILLFFASQTFAGDFTGKWSGEIKKISHPTAYGEILVELVQEEDQLSGFGSVIWEKGESVEFVVSAQVDQTLDMFFFSYEEGTVKEWGYGVLTDFEGEEAIAGSKFRKAGYHKPTETIDFILFRSE